MKNVLALFMFVFMSGQVLAGETNQTNLNLAQCVGLSVIVMNNQPIGTTSKFDADGSHQQKLKDLFDSAPNKGRLSDDSSDYDRRPTQNTRNNSYADDRDFSKYFSAKKDYDAAKTKSDAKNRKIISENAKRKQKRDGALSLFKKECSEVVAPLEAMVIEESKSMQEIHPNAADNISAPSDDDKTATNGN